MLLNETIMFLPIGINAQVTIGSLNPPADYSLLELDTENKKGGLRLPQLSEGTILDFKNFIASHILNADKTKTANVEGLEFYNLDTNCIEFWNGTSWHSLCGDEALIGYLDRITEIRDSLIVEFETRIEELETYIYNLEERIEYIENFTNLSSVTDYVCQSSFDGLYVSVIHSGFNYNFWGTGNLKKNFSMSNGGIYYLIHSGDTDNPESGICEPLNWYQGDVTIGTLWLNNTSGGTQYVALPLFFDSNGIYIKPTNNINVGVNSTYNFTQSLILVDPNNRPHSN
jgi:hypothetical protein